MKKLILLATILASAVTFGASPAATQDWVKNYIATNASTITTYVTESVTNGNVYICASNVHEYVTITGEIPYKLALVASNVTATATAMGVTNGMLFAWNGSGEWHNGPAGIFVSCVSNECFSFSGHKSTVVDGIDTFVGYFNVVGMKIPQTLWQSLQPQAVSHFSFSIFPCAYADMWSDMGGNWYKPSGYKEFKLNTKYFTSGKIGSEYKSDYFNVGYDEKGPYSDFSEVTKGWTFNANYLAEDVSGYVLRIVENAYHLQQIDEEFNTLSKNLDSKFANVMTKISNLELKDKEGNKSNLTKTGESASKVEYRTTVIGGASIEPDYASINKTSDKSITPTFQLFNFKNQGAGVQPYKNSEGKISYDNPWMKADDLSIVVDKNAQNRPVKSGNNHGIHIAGWHNPTEGHNACDETIAENLLIDEEDQQHYIVTKKFSGSDLGHVHYMKIGKLSNLVDPDNKTIVTNEVAQHSGQVSVKGFYGASNKTVPTKIGNNLVWTPASSALKITGTQGSPIVIGSGASTNNLTFASGSDSNVKVTVSGSSSDVTITFDVYWK